MSKDYSGSADSQDHQGAARSGLATGKVRWYAIVSLVIIAACLAEFLTGSTPILGAFANPLGLVFNAGLYGGGALLIREAAIRWRKRWGGCPSPRRSLRRRRGGFRRQDDDQPEFPDHRESALQSLGGI